MYHIVYLTTNLINNKIYVGVHSTYNLDDGYLGSGKALLRSIKKHGVLNFKRVILYYCLEAQDAYKIESNIVTISFINCRNNYNLKTGGSTSITGKMSEESKIRLSNARKGNIRSETAKQKQRIKNIGKLNPMASTFHFISPTGNVNIVIGEFQQFCINNNLSYDTMRNNINKSKIDISKYKACHIRPLTKNCNGWECIKLS